VLVTLTIAEGLERHAVAVFDADLPLVNAVRNGDESAFEELLRRYDGKLYRVAQGIIHNHEDAEEVVQAAFLKAYLNLLSVPGKLEVLNLADSHRHERIVHETAKATVKQRAAFGYR
jgi:hypothetical protein